MNDHSRPRIAPIAPRLASSSSDQVRSTARLPTPAGSAANACALLVAPASAFDADAAPGYVIERSPAGVRVLLGPVLYDQPRHVVLKSKAGEAFTVTLELGKDCLTVASANAVAANPTLTAVEELRVKAILAINSALKLGDAGKSTADVQAPLTAFVAEARASSVMSEPAVMALVSTLEKEGMLGCDQVIKDGSSPFKRWGAHYFRTLPCMLRNERRSNFRDEALQHFGRDAEGNEALFESQSNAAEMKFSTLKPPEPSLLNPPTPPPSHTTYGSSMPEPPRAAPAPRMMALPDEFMRGGGCFGPTATVQLASGRVVPVTAVCAGDKLLGEGGRPARVVCVVLTPCPGGRAMLTRLPNGTELTEWHPVRDRSGRWRFPHMLGERVVVSASHVYNFVLEPGHPTVLVGGVLCAALGHGLMDPIVAHPYWGTRAVIDDMMSQPGWAEGRVVLSPTAATERA